MRHHPRNSGGSGVFRGQRVTVEQMSPSHRVASFIALSTAALWGCGDRREDAAQVAAAKRAQQRAEFERSFETAVEAGDLSRAEALYREQKALLEARDKHDAATTLGNALFNPGGRYEPGPDTVWRSRITSRATEGGGCRVSGNLRSVWERELVRSREYFIEAGRYWFAANVAYRARDLGRFDADIAHLDGELSSWQLAKISEMRARLLVHAGRLDEALTYLRPRAEAIRTDRTCTLVGGDVQCKKTRTGRTYCPLWLTIGRIHEIALRFAEARTAYDVAAKGTSNYGCARTADVRSAALEKAKDGKPLPAFHVNVSVSAPAGATVRVRLVADLPETQNPISLLNEDLADADPASLDFFGDVFAIESTSKTGNRFTFDAVPPGAWNVVVIADGPAAYEAGESCWPHAIVKSSDVDLQNIEVVVDADNSVTPRANGKP